MSSEPNFPKDRDSQIELIVDQFVQRIRAGIEDVESELARELELHPDLNPELEERLRFAIVIASAFQESSASKNGDKSANRHSSFGSPVATRVLERFACPHCGNHVRIIDESPQAELTCHSCGSSFAVEGDVTTNYSSADFKHRLGKFELLREVGRGAFAQVFRAIDTQLNRTVAIKIPRTGTFGTRHEEQRFIREAQHAAKLIHPNIVRVYEIGQEQTMFIVSEFIEGLTLDDVISGRSLTYRQTAEYVAKIGDALEFAHKKGVIHRDVKPSNILIDQSDQPHLADFGLARTAEPEITMTREGEIVGTPAYMSPEQAAAEHQLVNRTSDVYSLGVMLYRMLSGELPFRGSRRMLLHQVMNDPPTPPRRLNDSIPRDLETIALKAMEKEQKKRYATAAEFSAEVRRWLGGDPILAKPPSSMRKLAMWCRKRPATTLMLATISALLISIAIGATIWAIQATRQNDLIATRELARQNQLVSVLYTQGQQAVDRSELARSLPSFVEQLAVQEELGDSDSAEATRIRIGETLKRIPRLAGLHQFDARIDDLVTSNESLFVLEGNSVHQIETDGWTIQRTLLNSHRSQRLFVNNQNSRVACIPNPAPGDGTTAITLWDLDSGNRIAELTHEKHITFASFSPTEPLVATSALDGTIRIWNSDTGVAVRKLDLEHLLVSRCRFSPDGKFMASFSQRRGGDGSCAIRIWDTSDWSFDSINASIYVTAFAFTENQLLASNSKGEVKSYSLSDAKDSGVTIKHDARVTNLHAIAGNRILVATEEQSLGLWRNDGTRIYGPNRINGNAVSSFAISDDRTFCVMPSSAESASVIWCQNGEEMDSRISHSSLINSLAVAKNRFAIIGGTNGVVKVWDLASVSGQSISVDPGAPVRFARFNNEGSRFVTVSLGGSVNFWDLNGEEIETHRNTNSVKIYFPPKSKEYVLGFGDGNLKSYSEASGELQWEMKLSDAPVSEIAFAPNANLVAAGDTKGHFAVWDLGPKVQKLTFKYPDPISDLIFDPSGEFVAVSSGFKTDFWHLDSAKTEKSFQASKKVNDLGFLDNGDRLLISSDSWHSVWDWETEARISRYRRKSNFNNVLVSRNGNTFFGDDVDGNGAVFDSTNLKKPRWVFTPTEVEAYDLHPTKDWVMVSGGDGPYRSTGGSAQIWNFETGRTVLPVYFHRGPVRAVFSPDGKNVVTASQDGTARIWKIEPTDLTVDQLNQLSAILAGKILEGGRFRSPEPEESQAHFELSRSLLPQTSKQQIDNWNQIRRDAVE